MEKKFKKIKRDNLSIGGLSISTRLPGAPEPTEKEREERMKFLEKQEQINLENQKKFLLAHPAPDTQMDKMLEMIQNLEGNGVKEKELKELKALVIKTKKDYKDYYTPLEY